MGDLKDYSGPFKADLKLLDFSPELLAEALSDLSHIYDVATAPYVAMDVRGFKASTGEEFKPMSPRMMMERTRLYWFQMVPKECKVICRRFKIRTGDGAVADLLKYFQLSPSVGLEKRITCELKDENHGVVTIHECLGLEPHEESNNLDMIEFMCSDMSAKQFQYTAWQINPRIKSVPLKLPPRKSKDEPPCQWEFTMMDKVVDEEGLKAWQELIWMGRGTERAVAKYLGE